MDEAIRLLDLVRKGRLRILLLDGRRQRARVDELERLRERHAAGDCQTVHQRVARVVRVDRLHGRAQHGAVVHAAPHADDGDPRQFVSSQQRCGDR